MHIYVCPKCLDLLFFLEHYGYMKILTRGFTPPPVYIVPHALSRFNKKVEMNTAIEFWPFIMNFDRGKWPELLEESHEVPISRHVTMMDRYRSLGTPNLDQLVDKQAWKSFSELRSDS